jgi:hypothetical protein
MAHRGIALLLDVEPTIRQRTADAGSPCSGTAREPDAIAD